MFNAVLGGIRENERVSLLEKVVTTKENGAESVSWEKVKTILCNIQADYQYGEKIDASLAGDKPSAIYNMYTKEKVVDGQRILRDNIVYEIRKVESNGIKTILRHYKAYLVRVDNQ